MKEAERLFNLVKKGIDNVKNVEVIICPPFPYLSILNNGSRTSIIKYGGQDCFWEEKGAYTGEVSSLMLKDLGCQYVIIGHSERRKYFEETDEITNKKLKAVLKSGLKPILCIGEKKMRIQMKRALAGIKKSSLKNIIITYEPVWAISTTKGGSIATFKEAKKGAVSIRKILTRLFNKSLAQKIKIIYGGSVDSKNIQGFIKEAKMDGVLIGAASLKAKEFVAALKKID